jgi:DNA ligase (NAD+)
MKLNTLFDFIEETQSVKEIKLTKSEYESLVKKLNKYSYEYYENNKAELLDSEYDTLYKKLLDYESINKSSKDSPTRRIGEKPSSKFVKKEHLSQMWSLDNIFALTEFDKWFEKIEKPELYLDPKFDGLSLNLIYKNGKLFSASTRGDGKTGEDVTRNAKTINTIPVEIPYLGEIEIRGEVVILKKDFEELQKSSSNSHSNPRNLASGSLRQLDPEITRERNLTFIPYSLGINDLNISKHSEIIELFEKWNFKVIKGIVVNSEKALMHYYQSILDSRDNLELEIDGVVIKVNNLSAQQELGYTIKAPKFALAFKFPASAKYSTLETVTWQVGRTGTITPVANINPVEVGGVIVRRVTLHNIDEIERLGLKNGATVNIVRRGDVIPKIENAIDGNSEIVIPHHCPNCNSTLVRDGVYLKCINNKCSSMLINKIDHYIKAMNIKGIGTKLVERLFEADLIKDFKDLYALDKEQLLKLEGIANKSADNILHVIAESIGTRELWRVIYGLGIEGIGESGAKILANKFGLEFYKVSHEQILNIDGFGIETANSFEEHLKNHQNEIVELLNITKPVVQQQTKQSVLTGKKIAITGTLTKPRNYYVELIEKLGGEFSSSITKSTSMLIIGSDAGSKLQKAKELNIEIIDEVEFLKRFPN